jgi:hypothetical protein
MLPAPRTFLLNKRAANKVARNSATAKRFFRPDRFHILSPAPGVNFYVVEVGSSSNNKREAKILKNALYRIKNRNMNTRHLYNTVALATRNNAFTRLVNAAHNAMISNRMRTRTPSPKRRRV